MRAGEMPAARDAFNHSWVFGRRVGI